jgi:ArsR family metal-binding transcriptional regulator
MLPYLNAILEKPNYQESSNSIRFLNGINEITIQENKIGIVRVANLTQAYELLDWVKDLINDAYESKSEITPNYESRKQPGVLQVYNALPKTNCKKCGEQSCMAFAAKLSKFDAEIDTCPLLGEPKYFGLREKLTDLL